MPSNNIPLLNEYKEEFLWKRVPQTLLGGPKLRLGYDAPPYVYLCQALLLTIPWIIGGVFTVLVEYSLIQFDIGAYIVGAVICLYVLCVQSIALILKRRKASVIPSEIHQKKNILGEEDEVLFESCCGFETVEFVVPGKRYKINILIHALLGGATCGLAFIYLLPNTLNAVFGNNTGVTVVLYILGWITLCIAQYSLTVAPPPEPATFRTVDQFEIAPLTRPFYVLVCCAFHMLARYLTGFTLVDQVLHILFIFLPLLWLFGALPPVDGVLLWSREQIYVHMYGGSPVTGHIRFWIMFLLAIGVAVAIYFIPKGIATVILLAAFGYIFSIDIGSLAAQLMKLCCKNTGRNNEQGIVTLPDGFLWSWRVKEFIFHFVMLGITVGVAAGIYYTNSLSTVGLSNATTYVGYIIIALLVTDVLLAEMQSVYVLFGLWRNKLYPQSADRTAIFLKRKKILNVFGIIRRIILNTGISFLSKL